MSLDDAASLRQHAADVYDAAAYDSILDRMRDRAFVEAYWNLHRHGHTLSHRDCLSPRQGCPLLWLARNLGVVEQLDVERLIRSSE